MAAGSSSSGQDDFNLSNGKVRTEVACALSWFSNWSHDQRKVFTDKLFSGLSLEDATEQLLQDMGGMSISEQRRECPSVFECQLKIFDGWFRNWTDADKMEFVNQICMRNDL